MAHRRLWVPESAEGDNKVRRPRIRLPHITVDTPDGFTRNAEMNRAFELQQEAERLEEARALLGKQPRRHHASPQVRKRRKAVKAAKKCNRRK